MSGRLNSRWTAGISDKEDAERLRNEIGASVLLFRRLRQILDETIDEKQSERDDVKQFELKQAGWTDYQTFTTGYIAGIRKVLALIPDLED